MSFSSNPTPGERPAQARRFGLRDLDVRRAPPAAEAYRMNDGRGLFLWVTPTGRKTWRTNYIVAGTKHLLTLGEYPAMSLAEAREARAGIRAKVREGGDPTAERRAVREARLERDQQTFEVMARKWHATFAATEWMPSYAASLLRQLERDVFPTLGERPIHQITRDEVITLLERRLLERDARTRVGKPMPTRAAADAVRNVLRSAFEHWVDRGLILQNPAAKLAKRFGNPNPKPHEAVVTIEDARAVLAAVEQGGRATLALALLHRFQALTCVRPTEAREARWSEFQSGVWSIPAERMKGRRNRRVGHTVPLSRQAEDVVEAARAVFGEAGPHVFPAFHRGTHAPLGASSLGDLLQRILPATLRHVPHGWRATFSTIMNERHPGEDRVFDAMLAHATKGATERRYNRTAHLDLARARGQEWADLLLEGAPSAWALASLTEPATADIVTFLREIREAAE